MEAGFCYDRALDNFCELAVFMCCNAKCLNSSHIGDYIFMCYFKGVHFVACVCVCLQIEFKLLVAKCVYACFYTCASCAHDSFQRAIHALLLCIF